MEKTEDSLWLAAEPRAAHAQAPQKKSSSGAALELLAALERLGHFGASALRWNYGAPRWIPNVHILERQIRVNREFILLNIISRAADGKFAVPHLNIQCDNTCFGIPIPTVNIKSTLMFTVECVCVCVGVCVCVQKPFCCSTFFFNKAFLTNSLSLFKYSRLSIFFFFWLLFLISVYSLFVLFLCRSHFTHLWWDHVFPVCHGYYEICFFVIGSWW